MFGNTPLVIIETTDAFNELIDKLRDAPVIGMDIEGDSLHHYRERVALVQLSDARADYIIDPLMVDDMSRLGELTGNPDQVLVLHGGDYDVVSLKRDFGCQFAGIFDTMIAGQFLGLPRIGLADLIKRYFGHHIDKKYQRHDWSSRPLESEHLDYARGDTHWLLALREVLMLQLGRHEKLSAHTEECDLLALREWGGRGGSATNFLKVKRSKGLDDAGLRVLRAVWTYRDRRALELDRPPFKVIPDDLLVELASKKPCDIDTLKQVFRPGSSLFRRHGEGLVLAVREGVADTTPLPEREVKAPKSKVVARVGRAGSERIFNALKSWRNRTVDKGGVAPVVVASNDLLRDIARFAPMSLEELSTVTGIRKWQVESFGEEIVDVIASVEVPLQSSMPSSGKSKRRRRRRRTKRTVEGQAESSPTPSREGGDSG